MTSCIPYFGTRGRRVISVTLQSPYSRKRAAGIHLTRGLVDPTDDRGFPENRISALPAANLTPNSEVAQSAVYLFLY
jgi:hypothetical protein